MSGVRGCPTCGSGNALEATQCWVCGSLITPGEAPPQTLLARQQQRHETSRRTFRILGWVAFLLGIFFICTLVAIELALEWPGLLIPFAGITLVVFVALGRIAYVQIRSPVPLPPEGGAKKGVSGGEVLEGVAMGLALAGAIIAGMMLLFVAAMVIFFLICIAMFAGLH